MAIVCVTMINNNLKQFEMSFPASGDLFKLTIKTVEKSYKICSKLTIKTPERCQ